MLGHQTLFASDNGSQEDGILLKKNLVDVIISKAW